MNETNENEDLKAGAAPESEDNEQTEVKLEAVSDKEAEASEENEEITLKKSDLDELEREKEDFKSKFYYIAAEKENLQKRFEREKENLIKYGNEKVLSGLLSVVDNLGLTLNAIASDEDEKVKNIFVGIEMVTRQFGEVLKNNGLEEIETLDKEFDPNLHEALMQREEEGKAANLILEEVQKGYILNGRVLRAAKVIISK